MNDFLKQLKEISALPEQLARLKINIPILDFPIPPVPQIPFSALSGISHIASDALITQSNAIQDIYNLNSICFAELTRSHESFCRSVIETTDIVTMSALTSIAELNESISSALSSVLPYIPDEQHEEYEAFFAPFLAGSNARKLTLSDYISLISIFVTIFCMLSSNLSDDELEQISAQNKIIINQQSELIDSSLNESSLMDTLETLTNTIHLLNDEIESLREDLECTDNIPTEENQSEVTDSD